MFGIGDGVMLNADDEKPVLCCVEKFFGMSWRRFDVHFNLWLRNAVVDIGLYVHWGCKLEFRVHGVGQ